MHEDRVFKDVERLRSPERVARLEPERVVEVSLEGLRVTKLLDVGTGSGLFAEAFYKQQPGLEVSGVDINPAMLEAARRYLPQGHFQAGKAEELPFEDGLFELVFIGLVLHEVSDLKAALREARRVTTHRVAALEWPYLEQEFGPPLAHRLKPEEVEKVAREVGFSRFESFHLDKLVLYRMEV